MSRRSRFAFSLLAVALAASCNSKSSPAAVAPDIEMIKLDQIQARLADDKAHGKIAVMHMWATWCGPCVEEFPSLAKLHREVLMNDSQIDFFAVSVDDPGNKDDVTKFVAEAGARFPVFIADAPDQEAFSRGINPGWPAVLPTTFIYGRDGQTKNITMGEIEDQGQFRRQLEAAKR